MDWKSTWATTVGKCKFSTPIDVIDAIDKKPIQKSANHDSVNCVDIVMRPSKQTAPNELPEEIDVFLYLHNDLASGGAYLRLWPQVRRYLQRELPQELFIELDGLANLKEPVCSE